jgi:hypothetical protein
MTDGSRVELRASGALLRHTFTSFDLHYVVNDSHESWIR